MIQASRALGLDSGQLIAVPIPEESEAMGDEMERAVQEALGEATEQLAGGGGNAATPFLLGRVAQLTGGRSLKANVALVENNARVGARIAVFLSQLEREGSLQA